MAKPTTTDHPVQVRDLSVPEQLKMADDDAKAIYVLAFKAERLRREQVAAGLPVPASAALIADLAIDWAAALVEAGLT